MKNCAARAASGRLLGRRGGAGVPRQVECGRGDRTPATDGGRAARGARDQCARSSTGLNFIPGPVGLSARCAASLPALPFGRSRPLSARAPPRVMSIAVNAQNEPLGRGWALRTPPTRMAAADGCREWLPRMAAANGCREWLPRMVAAPNGCRRWLLLFLSYVCLTFTYTTHSLNPSLSLPPGPEGPACGASAPSSAPLSLSTPPSRSSPSPSLSSSPSLVSAPSPASSPTSTAR